MHWYYTFCSSIPYSRPMLMFTWTPFFFIPNILNDYMQFVIFLMLFFFACWVKFYIFHAHVSLQDEFPVYSLGFCHSYSVIYYIALTLFLLKHFHPFSAFFPVVLSMFNACSGSLFTSHASFLCHNIFFYIVYSSLEEMPEIHRQSGLWGSGKEGSVWNASGVGVYPNTG